MLKAALAAEDEVTCGSWTIPPPYLPARSQTPRPSLKAAVRRDPTQAGKGEGGGRGRMNDRDAYALPGRTLTARGPFSPRSISNSTFSPSFRPSKLRSWRLLRWKKISCPSEDRMKPNPRSRMTRLIVPCIVNLDVRKRERVLGRSKTQAGRPAKKPLLR